jgi:uncharacterized SAM-binding protein YcdF (DUF218 family)
VPFLALAALAGLGLGRHRRTSVGLLMLSLLGLWLSCSDGAAQWLALHVVKAPQAISGEAIAALKVRQAQQGDVAVLVLGGGVRRFSPEYDGPGPNAITLERFRYGVWLARQVGAPLGFSGGIGWSARHLTVSEASVVARTAREEFGLPLRWAEGRSRDTRENAVLSLVQLRADGISTVLLVTHDLHMPRAERAFREAAAEPTGKPIKIVVAPVGLHRDAMSEMSDWMPSDDGLARVRYAVYEWLALRAGH